MRLKFYTKTKSNVQRKERRRMQNEEEEDFFLKNCLSIINTFLPILTNNKQNTFFLIECGYYFLNNECVFFHTNIGKDFVSKIQEHCMNNNLQQHTCTYTERFVMCSQAPKIYKYVMTPFDIRCRLFHIYDNNDNETKQSVLQQGDHYFTCDYETIIFFNKNTGRLGVYCSLSQTNISVFFLIHQCLLIIRDFVCMIETKVDDKEAKFMSV